MTTEKEFKLGKLCEKVQTMSLDEFKRFVIANLKWYGIPKTWRIIDIEEFYNKHREAN